MYDYFNNKLYSQLLQYYISVLTTDGKLVATNEDGKPIDGVAGKCVENEAVSAVLANSFAEFENRDGKDDNTESKTDSKSRTDRLVLCVDSGWFFVSRVCTDFLVGCHVLKSAGISMKEATEQVRVFISLPFNLEHIDYGKKRKLFPLILDRWKQNTYSKNTYSMAGYH